jgi:hypothetical protein
MKLVSAGNQERQDFLYVADGVIADGGTPQLVLARSMSRSSLILQNLSAHDLYFDIGSARATATISNGQVTSCAVTNAGFNFTHPPVIRFLGGGLPTGNTSYLGLNQPNGPAPSHPALAHCVLTGDAVSSIVIDDPGAGYVIAPYVFIFNSDLDPYGAPIPGTTSGFLLTSGSAPVAWNGTTCPSESVAVYGASTNDPYLARWMD